MCLSTLSIPLHVCYPLIMISLGNATFCLIVFKVYLLKVDSERNPVSKKKWVYYAMQLPPPSSPNAQNASHFVGFLPTLTSADWAQTDHMTEHSLLSLACQLVNQTQVSTLRQPSS